MRGKSEQQTQIPQRAPAPLPPSNWLGLRTPVPILSAPPGTDACVRQASGQLAAGQASAPTTRGPRRSCHLPPCQRGTLSKHVPVDAAEHPSEDPPPEDTGVGLKPGPLLTRLSGQGSCRKGEGGEREMPPAPASGSLTDAVWAGGIDQ